MENSNIRHMIAISSGKGGVGKSSTTVHLALELARAGHKVGVLDADIHGPNLPTMLGATDNPRLETIDGVECFVPPVSHGIKMMSMGFLLDGDQPVIWRGPMLHNLLTQFAKQIVWGDLDYLLIDMPPGTGDVQISLSQLFKLRGAVLVTTPQEVAMQDVRKAFKMWEQVKVPVMGIVENMSFFENPIDGQKHYLFGQGGAQILADKYHLSVLGEVPLLEALREGMDTGRPFSLRDRESGAVKAYEKIASEVVSRAEQMSQEVDPSQIMQIGKFD